MRAAVVVAVGALLIGSCAGDSSGNARDASDPTAADAQTATPTPWGAEADAAPAGESSVIMDMEPRDLPTDANVWQLTYRSGELAIEGFALTPPDDNGPYPVLIYNRGGNRDFGAIDDGTVARTLSHWAEKGYVVLASQYRGAADSEGQDEFGGDDVDDVLALAHVADELDAADADQMVMVGHSRGGMMAYLAIKRGMNLEAGAVVAGPTDLLYALENRSDMERVYRELVGDPDEEPEAFKARSAVEWPEALLNTPLILVHAEDDRRVSFDHASRLKAELDAANHDAVTLLAYEDGGHSLDAHFHDYAATVHEWFQDHLD